MDCIYNETMEFVYNDAPHSSSFTCLSDDDFLTPPRGCYFVVLMALYFGLNKGLSRGRLMHDFSLLGTDGET